MEWINSIPKWLFGASFLALMILLIYLAISGVEFRYTDRIRFVDPETISSVSSQQPELLNPWTNSALGGGWTNYGANFAPVGYTTDVRGVVYLRGLAKGGESGVGNTIFILPKDLRPEYVMEIVVACAGAIPCEAIIQRDGKVWFERSDQNWVSFDGVSFPSVNSALP